MDALELSIQRLNTEAFIKADPVSLILYRSTRIRNSSGGFTWDRGDTGHGTPLVDPQLFRLIPLSQSETQDEVKSSNGRTLKPNYRILATYSADVERWDHFQFKGVWYEIVSPPAPMHSIDSVYQKKANVVVYQDA